MMQTAIEINDAVHFTVKERFAAYLELTKPRIAFLLVLTAAAGFYLGTTGTFDWVNFAVSMTGITLLAFGVATLNQYLERAIDPLMERTAKRPIPTAKVSSTEALIFGLVQCAVSITILFALVNSLTALLGIIVIVGYVLVYTPLKTRTTLSTAIGAIPGALPPLMGWTAAADSITLGAWALFVIQFLWQFPHFFAIAWIYREQYKKAGIRMLPVVEPEGRLTMRQIAFFTIMLLPVSFGPYFLGNAGLPFLIGAVLLGLGFLIISLKTAITKSDADARKVLLYSVIYLPIFFILMVIDKQ